MLKPNLLKESNVLIWSLLICDLYVEMYCKWWLKTSKLAVLKPDGEGHTGHRERIYPVGRGWWLGPNAGHRPVKVKQSVLFRKNKRSYTSMNDRYFNTLELTQALNWRNQRNHQQQCSYAAMIRPRWLSKLGSFSMSHFLGDLNYPL